MVRSVIYLLSLTNHFMNFLSFSIQNSNLFSVLLFSSEMKRLGGSIYGGTEMFKTKGLTKENYMKLNRVPDWTNLEDNRPWGN